MADLTTNSDETYEKILTGNLQRTIDFLKFSEAKYAALLALSSAWVVAIINLECSGRTIPGYLAVSIVLALPFSLCAGLLAMVSFLPRLHLPGFLGGKRAGPHAKNLLYFGDISAVPLKTLAQDLHARYCSSSKGYREEYIHDLVVQLSVNSDVTMRKMRLFRWGNDSDSLCRAHSACADTGSGFQESHNPMIDFAALRKDINEEISIIQASDFNIGVTKTASVCGSRKLGCS